MTSTSDSGSGTLAGVVLILVSLLGQGVRGTYLCTPQSGDDGGHKLPEITGSYVAYMEWWEVGTQSVTFREDYVDQEHNMAAVRIHGQFDPGDIYTYISDYNTSQLYTISETSSGKSCKASKLDPAESFVLPFERINNTDHLARTPLLLQFGQSFGERYVGGMNIRGKDTILWRACFKDNSTNITTQADFYFTADGWTTATTDQPTPMQSTISRFIPGRTSAMDITITVQVDYMFFQNYLTDRSIFQIPVSMYCEGRKPSKPVPSIPNHFRFRSERIITHLNEVGEYDEWYNQESKIVRIDSKPMPGDMAVLDLSTRTEILDFNMGISYLIMQDTGMCDITPIMPEEFNSKVLDANHVTLKTPQEFFHFDSGNFIYSGRTVVRDVDTETWIGTRTDFPLGLSSTSIWQWYFSTDEWSVTQFGEPQKNVPVLLKIDIPDKDLHYLYNIYDFSPKDPDLVDFDVSSCYQQHDLRHLQFSLIGNTQLPSKLPKLFQYQLSLRLRDIMGVSLLRISHTQTDFYSEGVYVIFTLLDPPNFQGDVAGTLNSNNLTSSETAVNSLDSFLQLGSVFLHFMMEMNAQNFSVPFVSVPFSLQDNIRYSNGSSQRLDDTTAPPSYSYPDQRTPVTAASGGPASSSAPSSSQSASFSSTSLPPPPPSSSSTSTKPTTSVKPDTRSARQKTATVIGQSTADPSSGPCDIGQSSQEQQWTSGTVAGLSVGLAVCSILVGFGLAVVVSKLPFLRRMRAGKEEERTLAYTMM